uniref:Armadillo-like helical domain-containing protein 4 n=2 Tax=Callorhinchus milii TaxID=7868 RepID=A0A4W3GEY1_CALMI
MSNATEAYEESREIPDPSLGTPTPSVSPGIGQEEAKQQTDKTGDKSLLTTINLNVVLPTTLLPSQKPFNVSANNKDLSEDLQPKPKDLITTLTTSSSSDHAKESGSLSPTAFPTLGSLQLHSVTANDSTSTAEEPVKIKENMSYQVTASTAFSQVTKNLSSLETTWITDSSTESFGMLNSHDTTALPLTSKTVLTVSTAHKTVSVMKSEMSDGSEFTTTNSESLRNNEVTAAITSEPESNYLAWKTISGNSDKDMNEIMATTANAVTDSKAPKTFQVTSTPRVTTEIKLTINPAQVSSDSTGTTLPIETMLKTVHPMQVTNSRAMSGTTKKQHKGWSARLIGRTGTSGMRPAMPTTLLPDKSVSEANNAMPTKERPSAIPTEMMLPTAKPGTAKMTEEMTAGNPARQVTSLKANEMSEVTDPMLVLLTTNTPSARSTVPPSSAPEELGSEAMTVSTAFSEHGPAVPVGNDVHPSTVEEAASPKTILTATRMSPTITPETPEVLMTKPSTLSPVLRESTWASLAATTAPSMQHPEPPAYTLETADSEEEEDDEDEDDEDEDEEEEEEEDEDSDSDEDNVDYDTEVPSQLYITPGGPITDAKNFTKVVEMSYQLPDSFEWSQHDQGTKNLVRSWLEKIKDKAGYMSGMLVPVGVGVTGALFILGALYSLKVMNRRRKNGFKRREAKPRDFTSMQDRVMLLADSSEDEF